MGDDYPVVEESVNLNAKKKKKLTKENFMKGESSELDNAMANKLGVGFAKGKDGKGITILIYESMAAGSYAHIVGDGCDNGILLNKGMLLERDARQACASCSLVTILHNVIEILKMERTKSISVVQVSRPNRKKRRKGGKGIDSHVFGNFFKSF